MKHLDLFSGAGGFTLALKNIFGSAYQNVGYSEIDKHAIANYNYNFPGHKNYGTITDIRESDLPDFDLCTFGFPCQDVSIAGKGLGFDGHRSSLFYQAIRIINAKRPKYFIFENVKGLLSSKKGKVFFEVLQTIADIGYDGQWQLLNTKWFLPQNRERIFFIGYVANESRPEIFPFTEMDFSNQSATKEIVSNTIDANYAKGPNKGNRCSRTLIQISNIDNKGHNSIWGRVYNPEGIATTINSNGGGLGAITGLYSVAALRSRENRQHFERRADFCTNTLTSVEKDNLIYSNDSIRRLTPIECERLQGFPDDWTKYGNYDGKIKKIADRQRYKLCGNAISIPVVEAISLRLKDSL
jgi:DNA (cytosine-5)-methyltransferase 1